MTSLKVLFILCAFIACFVVSHEDHTNCRHDEIDHNPGFLDIDEDFPEPDEEGRRLSSASKMRIYPYYKLLGGSSSYNSYMQNRLVPPVVSFFQGALKVKYPVSGNLKVGSNVRTVCGKSTPSILFGSGVAADYFIFFTTTADSGSWIAESTACYLATGSNRPLISNTLLNRNLLRDAGSDVLLHEKNMYLLLHEMTHTFGFSYSLYKYFLDSNGRQRSGHIRSMKLDGSTSVVVDVSPLTSRLRSHFGCSSLAGAYMENSGSTATAGSHFERRHFGFEALTSGLNYQQKYSELSLAMLEGSGWYLPDYDYGEPFYFGQGQGCSFLTQSCSSSSFQFEEFCKTSYRGCTPQGGGGGSCSTDIRSDNCRFVHSDVNYDCQNTKAANYARLPALQAFGRNANSQCFTGTLSTGTGASTTSFCFKYSCSGSGSGAVVHVQVGTQSVTCTRKGTVTVSGYKGAIDCPDPLQFCQTVGRAHCPRNCMGRGSCINGKCSCYSGYSGIDCAL